MRDLAYAIAVIGLAMAIGACVPGSASTATDVQIHFGAEADPSAEPLLLRSEDRYDPSARRLRLYAARNEVLGFPCTIRTPGRVNVQVGELRHESGSLLSGIGAIYRRHPVTISTWPGWHIRSVPPSKRQERHDDVLVPANAPRGGLPARVTARDPLNLWIDLRIPADAEGGVYSGELAVEIDGRPAKGIPVELTVWPFALPDDPGLAILANVDHRALFAHHVRRGGRPYGPARVLTEDESGPELDRVLTATMAMLHADGLTPQLPELYPIAKITAEQSLSVDWTDYVGTVGPYLDGSAFPDGRGLARWLLPLNEEFPEPPTYGAMQSPTYSRLIRDYLSSAAACYGEHGWLERSTVPIPYAVPGGRQAAEAVKHFGYIIRNADPRWRIRAPLFPQDMSAFGWHGYLHEDIRNWVDVWSPPAQFFDRPGLLADRGREAWLVMDRPPFSGTTSLAGSPGDVRVLAWQADAGKATAVALGKINPWPKAEGRETSPQACVDADPRTLIYPGTSFGLDVPVPSMRLKYLREGLQDIAYIALLRAAGREHIAVTLRNSLLAYFGVEAYGPHCADGRSDGWMASPAYWDAARQLMADELVSVHGGGARAGADMRWSRFMDASRHVRILPAGTRIRFAGVQPEEGIDVECTLAFSNYRRTPLTGQISFGELPVGWTADAPTRRVNALAPGGSRGVVLTARATTLPSEPNGILRLPFVFEEEDGSSRTVMARVAQVAAVPLPKAPRLDGDLADWPIGAGNCATDLALLSGHAETPTHATLCFVGRVGNSVYLALRCEIGSGSEEAIHTSDIVPEDGVLRGPDCVELLFDPANAGTRSPADLYRVVVRSGGVRAEWGVTTVPPTGPQRSWAPDIRHAMRTRSSVWTAELEIPLDAFPESYREQSIWGFNVVRFDAAAQESSNWAGAVGNVYDPLALGNLLLP